VRYTELAPGRFKNLWRQRYRPIPQLYQHIRRRAGGGRYASFMLHTTGIAAAVTATFVIWFTIVALALGSTLWPLLAGVH
jgi:hypothetical protein